MHYHRRLEKGIGHARWGSPKNGLGSRQRNRDESRWQGTSHAKHGHRRPLKGQQGGQLALLGAIPVHLIGLLIPPTVVSLLRPYTKSVAKGRAGKEERDGCTNKYKEHHYQHAHRYRSPSFSEGVCRQAFPFLSKNACKKAGTGEKHQRNNNEGTKQQPQVLKKRGTTTVPESRDITKRGERTPDPGKSWSMTPHPSAVEAVAPEMVTKISVTATTAGGGSQDTRAGYKKTSTFTQ